MPLNSVEEVARGWRERRRKAEVDSGRDSSKTKGPRDRHVAGGDVYNEICQRRGGNKTNRLECQLWSVTKVDG